MTKPIQTAMLIDDEEFDQRAYQRVIERSGLVETILCFDMAEDALDHLRQHPDLVVDVIFLDINMPSMNGFDFLEVASKEFPTGFAKIVVAMLTTSLNPGDEEKARSYDAVKAFINKPLTTEKVEEVAAL